MSTKYVPTGNCSMPHIIQLKCGGEKESVALILQLRCGYFAALFLLMGLCLFAMAGEMLADSAGPGKPGTCILDGHRDTSFKFL